MYLRIAIVLSITLITSAASAQSNNNAHFCDIVPAMHNRHLEEAAICAANKKAAQSGCREEYKRATIVSSAWELYYDDMGVLLGRKIHMELYGETWDGRCGATHFVFRQTYLGHHQYTRLRCDQMGDFYAMDCESGHDHPASHYGEW